MRKQHPTTTTADATIRSEAGRSFTPLPRWAAANLEYSRASCHTLTTLIMTMKKCYIAGKISNLPEHEYVANFHAGAAEVEQMGLWPILPINLIHDHDKSWLSHMRVDLSALLQCDYLFALRDWKESRGATIEVNLARSLGIAVLEQSAFDEAERVSADPETARAYIVAQGYDVDAFVERGLRKIRELSAKAAH